MLSFSKKLLYAIEAVADIAYNTGGEPVQSGDITQRQGIPRRYLEPVLQQLVRAGILAGVRGPKGGYRLARERRRITLGDITRVVCAVDEEEGPDVTHQIRDRRQGHPAHVERRSSRTAWPGSTRSPSRSCAARRAAPASRAKRSAASTSRSRTSGEARARHQEREDNAGRGISRPRL